MRHAGMWGRRPVCPPSLMLITERADETSAPRYSRLASRHFLRYTIHMTAHRDARRQFASDNYSGVCPEVMAALQEANAGHAQSYGDDPWTADATALIRDLFETDCEVFFVFNGTAANSLALASMCDSFHSVICYAAAHVETDECGAPGFFRHGITTMPLTAENGKLRPELIERAALNRRDVHSSKPRAVSLTQATELGTVYSPDEISAITKTTRK